MCNHRAMGREQTLSARLYEQSRFTGKLASDRSQRIGFEKEEKKQCLSNSKSKGI